MHVRHDSGCLQTLIVGRVSSSESEDTERVSVNFHTSDDDLGIVSLALVSF